MATVDKPYTQNRVALWWFYEEGREPIWRGVGIFRLLRRRYPEESTVIFECLLPWARKFIENVDDRSIVDVRYVEQGNIDNPRNGISLYYLRNITPKEWWINRLSRVEYGTEPIVLRLHAACDIDVVCNR